MRKRWVLPEGFWRIVGPVLLCLWAFGWIPLFFVISELKNGCDAGGCGIDAYRGAPVGYIFLGVWFGVVMVPAILLGLGFVAVLLWRVRPRRVTESVEDIRERYEEP